jgi:DNA-binding transcriptional ArsR family regulator
MANCTNHTGVLHKPYSDELVIRVARIYGELHAMGDAITISAIARRAGVSRASVRAILRQEFGWTQAHSQAAHQAGTQRGQLLQAVAGHPGLARGRRTLGAQGWPNLQKGHRTLAATGHGGLGRGRATQAAKGWPALQEERRKWAEAGYPQLERGRRNLAVRSWPNWQKAHAVLAAQEYLPLLEGRLLTRHHYPLPEADRRVMRGRSTQLAILEALEALQARLDCQHANVDHDAVGTQGSRHRVTGRELAAQLQLHPTTVYAHLKQLRALGVVDAKYRVRVEETGSVTL